MRRGLSLLAITMDCTDVLRTAAFWSGLFDEPLREPLPGWRRLGPLTSGGPVLTFQPVAEPKQSKVRLHLDLQVDDLPGCVALVQSLGGQGPEERHDYAEGAVVVMADVESNEFCLVWRSEGVTA